MSQMASDPIIVEFKYYLPPSVPRAPSTADLELINGSRDQDTVHMPVHDLRGQESSFSLDTNGFAYLKSSTSMSREDFDHDRRIETVYYPEAEQLLKKCYTKISMIHRLGHIIRGAALQTDFSEPAKAWNMPNRSVAPAPRVHIDFTTHGTNLVLAQAFGSELSAQVQARGKRVISFSVWRPLRPVHRDPLGIVDCRTVCAADLVKLPRIFPDGAKGENIVVKVNGREEGAESLHRWYYKSKMEVDDVVIIKLSDTADCAWESNPEGRVGCSPHASFAIPGTEEEEIRESIECRFVVEL